MQDSLRLLSEKLVRRVWMRNEHDRLRHSRVARAGAKELVRQLRRRAKLESEPVTVKMQRRLHVIHQEDDLRQALHAPGHAARAATIAARFMSFARVGTEHPGASSNPRPPVSATARRASASTSRGGP